MTNKEVPAAATSRVIVQSSEYNKIPALTRSVDPSRHCFRGCFLNRQGGEGKKKGFDMSNGCVTHCVCVPLMRLYIMPSLIMAQFFENLLSTPSKALFFKFFCSDSPGKPRGPFRPLPYITILQSRRAIIFKKGGSLLLRPQCRPHHCGKVFFGSIFGL